MYKEILELLKQYKDKTITVKRYLDYENMRAGIPQYTTIIDCDDRNIYHSRRARYDSTYNRISTREANNIVFFMNDLGQLEKYRVIGYPSQCNSYGSITLSNKLIRMIEKEVLDE